MPNIANVPARLPAISKNTDFRGVVIGNSAFLDDVWDLSFFIPSKVTVDYSKKIPFGYIKSEDMKHTAKLYAYHKLGQVSPKTVCGYFIGLFPSFVNYCNENGILSFSEVTNEVFKNYVAHLRNKGVSPSTGFRCCFLIEDIIRTGMIKSWNVSSDSFFAIPQSSGIWKHRNAMKERKTQPILEGIFTRILSCAQKETNILTRSAIFIQSQTGLRISEVLSLTTGCIRQNDNAPPWMEVSVRKTEKNEAVMHRVLVNELVVKTVHEMEVHSQNLRNESGLKELFLVKVASHRNKIGVISIDSIGKRFYKFVETWDIRDSAGELYYFTSHQFRATFVRELIKKKVPLPFIMEHFAHVSIDMTDHYLTLSKEDVRKACTEMLLNSNAKIAGIKAQSIKATLKELYRGKTVKEIKDITLELAETMSFNPLPTGACLHDALRGNCLNGDGCFFYNCPNYITDITFYPILKRELDLFETEMSRYKALDRGRDVDRLYVKYMHLKPLVEDLEAQMESEVQDGEYVEKTS